MNELEPVDVVRCLGRHASGDWGECSPEDWQLNDEAARWGGRLFSVYRDRDGHEFWIVTEEDRSVTTALLPGEF